MFLASLLVGVTCIRPPRDGFVPITRNLLILLTKVMVSGGLYLPSTFHLLTY